MEHFTDQDKADVIAYMNMVSRHAQLSMTQPELIKYFHLLSAMQKTIIPKIEGHIFELIASNDAPEES